MEEQATNLKRKPVRGSEELPALGQVWYLAPVGPEQRRRYAGGVRVRARQRLLDDRPFLTEDQYVQNFKSLEARINAGDYDWGPPREINGSGMGEAVADYYGSERGKLDLLRMLMAPAHDDLPDEAIVAVTLDNPLGMNAALRAALGLPPNPTAPAAGTTTPGTTGQETSKPEAGGEAANPVTSQAPDQTPTTPSPKSRPEPAATTA